MRGTSAVRRLAMGLGLCGLLGGCGSKLTGTYTNATGIVMLELKSGGKATMGLGGETKDCTYAEEGKQIRLTCAGDRIALRVNDDGSLWAPGFVGVMKKSR